MCRRAASRKESGLEVFEDCIRDCILGVARYRKARCSSGIDGPLHVVLDLRAVALPERDQRTQRVLIAPVDAQIHDGPRHLPEDEQACRMHGSRFAAGSETRAERGQQSLAQRPTTGFEPPHHRRRYLSTREQITCRGHIDAAGLVCNTQGVLSGMNEGCAESAEYDQLTIGRKRRPGERPLSRGSRIKALRQAVEYVRRESGIGEILRRHHADLGATVCTARGYRRG
jgi:hypothetical protein